MFAYCDNNPVMRYDSAGEFSTAIMGDDGNLLNDWILEGAGAGGHGGSGNYFGSGTAYYNYSVYSDTAAYNAYHSTHYLSYSNSSCISSTSAIINNAASKVPNPWGKKGSPAHQGKICSIKDDYSAKGYKVKTEVKIETTGGYKPYRYADLSITDRITGETFYVNVGKQLKSGIPCIRERYALYDIRTHGYSIQFIPYN